MVTSGRDDGLGGIGGLASQVFHKFGLNGEEPGVALVPETFSGNTVGAHFHLHEVVHVNIIDVELGIRDAHGGEWRLVSQDAELFALTVKLDILDLTKWLTVLDFELAGDTDLFVLAPADIEYLDHVVLGNNSHVAALYIHKGDLTLRLCHGNDLLDLASKAANLDLVALLVLDYGIFGQCHNRGVRFEVASKLRAFLTLDIVYLSEFAIPEKCVGLAAVDALDIHPEGHDYLIVSIG